MFSSLCLCLVWLPGQDPAPADRMPRALERAFQQRTNFKTAVFKYRSEEHRGDGREFIINLESRVAGEDIYMIDSGDDDGVSWRRDINGNRPFGVCNACLPEHSVLVREGKEAGCWNLSGCYEHLGYHEEPRPDFVDIRAEGLLPTPRQDQSPMQVLDKLRHEQMTWRQETGPDGVVRVYGRYAEELPGGDAAESVWEIDPARDYAILRAEGVRVAPSGTRRTIASMTATYARFSDRWWPARIEWGYPGSSYSKVVEFKSAEFDRPGHAKTLTVRSLGVPIGVEVLGRKSETGEYVPMRYVGEGHLLSEAAWETTKNQYDLDTLKAFYKRQNSMGRGYFPAWWDAGPNLGLEQLEYRPDAWEAYVRRWITKHQPGVAYAVPHPIEEKQVNTAWSILKECRKRAEPVRARVDKELTETTTLIQTRTKELEAASGSQIEKSTTDPRLEDARRREKTLQNPPEIKALFDELCQRLEGMLTAEQKVPGAYVHPTIPESLRTPRRRK